MTNKNNARNHKTRIYVWKTAVFSWSACSTEGGWVVRRLQVFAFWIWPHFAVSFDIKKKSLLLKWREINPTGSLLSYFIDSMRILSWVPSNMYFIRTSNFVIHYQIWLLNALWCMIHQQIKLSNGKLVSTWWTKNMWFKIYAPTPHFKALLVKKDSKVPWDIQFPTVNCLGRL